MIAFSGASLLTTVNPANGTDFVDQVKVILAGAGGVGSTGGRGWTVVAGSSGIWTLQSATTPEGLNCILHIEVTALDNASFQFRDLTQLNASPTHYAFTSFGSFKMHANQYQFFLWVVDGIVINSRLPGTFVAGGVPKLEEPLLDRRVNVIWSQANSLSETDPAVYNSFRNKGDAMDDGNSWQLINGNAWTSQWGIDPERGRGCQRLGVIRPLSRVSADQLSFVSNRVIWHYQPGDGADNPGVRPNEKPMWLPARIGWNITDPFYDAEIQGLLWDALVATCDMPDGAGANLLNKSWINLTALHFQTAAEGGTGYFYQTLLGLFVLATND